MNNINLINELLAEITETLETIIINFNSFEISELYDFFEINELYGYFETRGLYNKIDINTLYIFYINVFKIKELINETPYNENMKNIDTEKKYNEWKKVIEFLYSSYCEITNKKEADNESIEKHKKELINSIITYFK